MSQQKEGSESSQDKKKENENKPNAVNGVKKDEPEELV
jgi:hypothetical protein